MQTKECTKCNKTKNVEEFRFRNKAKNTRTSWCKACYSEYEKQTWKNSENRRNSNKARNKNRVQRNKEHVWNYLLENPCENCGNNDPRVLEFDHIDRSDKYNNISNLINSSYSIERIMEEISKCRILCANCHRIHTYSQCNWWKGD